MADGTDWRDTPGCTTGLAAIIDECWAQHHTTRPTFGGECGIAERLDTLAAITSLAQMTLGKDHASSELKAAGRRMRAADVDVFELQAQLASLQSAQAASEVQKQQLRDEVNAYRIAHQCAVDEAASAVQSLRASLAKVQAEADVLRVPLTWGPISDPLVSELISLPELISEERDAVSRAFMASIHGRLSLRLDSCSAS